MTETAFCALIPKSQKFKYRISPVDAGKLMNAEALGNQMTAIAKIMRLCANEDGPKHIVALTAALIEESGTVEFEFAVLPYKDESLSKSNTRQKAREVVA